MRTVAARLGVAGLGLLVLAGPGCRRADLPRTYPVTGTVAFPDGSPVKGGAVHFRSETDPSLTVTGAIKEDGTFALETVKDTAKAPGAPEGSYTVTVLPPAGKDQRLAMPPAVLPQPCRVQPGDNHFDLRVPPP
jgi:hypothetical protein